MSSPRVWLARLVLLGLCAGLGCLLGAPAPAQQSKYPRINLARGYVVDAKWPQRPDDLRWAEVPGVAVDARDQVWITTRSHPPVQVYDAKGQFVAAWGSELLKRNAAHHIRIDPE